MGSSVKWIPAICLYLMIPFFINLTLYFGVRKSCFKFKLILVFVLPVLNLDIVLTTFNLLHMHNWLARTLIGQ